MRVLAGVGALVIGAGLADLTVDIHKDNVKIEQRKPLAVGVIVSAAVGCIAEGWRQLYRALTKHDRYIKYLKALDVERIIAQVPTE